MCIEIPPKYSVASIIGFLKGESAIAITQQFNPIFRTLKYHIQQAPGFAEDL